LDSDSELCWRASVVFVDHLLNVGGASGRVKWAGKLDEEIFGLGLELPPIVLG